MGAGENEGEEGREGEREDGREGGRKDLHDGIYCIKTQGVEGLARWETILGLFKKGGKGMSCTGRQEKGREKESEVG